MSGKTAPRMRRPALVAAMSKSGQASAGKPVSLTPVTRLFRRNRRDCANP
jgi:hypothetical protein